MKKEKEKSRRLQQKEPAAVDGQCTKPAMQPCQRACCRRVAHSVLVHRHTTHSALAHEHAAGMETVQGQRAQ